MNNSPGVPISSLLMSEPAVDTQGRLMPWLGFALQALLNQVGNDGTGTAPTQSITESLTELGSNTTISLGTLGTDGATLQRIAALEQAVELTPLAPAAAHSRQSPPLAPAPNLSALLDQTFGNAQGMVLFRGEYGWLPLAAGTAGQHLTTAGAAANPYWS